MKVLLNRLDDPRMSECRWVGKGDVVVATSSAEEYGFTVSGKYQILDVCSELIYIENNKGEKEWYAFEYFE